MKDYEITAWENCDEFEKLRSLAKSRMSSYRYIHTLGVAKRAAKLARIYGEDEYRAYRAGLLHDICKDIPKTEMLGIIERYIPDFAEKLPEWYNSQALWHSLAAAIYAENELHEQDVEILNSVRYHTSARAGMSRMEEIIYLADLTSEDRSYPDADVVRQLSETDVSAAMLYSLKYIVCDLVSKNAQLTSETVAAYNQYVMLK